MQVRLIRVACLELVKPAHIMMAIWRTILALRDALEFIYLAAGDDDVRAGIAALESSSDLEAVVALAGNHALDFTVEELRKAFALDWSMRRMHYSAAAGSTPPSRDVSDDDRNTKTK